MMRTYRYRAYPNVTMERKLLDWIRACCNLYNAAIEQRTMYPKWLPTLSDKERLERDESGEVLLDANGKPCKRPSPATYFGQCVQLTALRQEDRRDAQQRNAAVRAELLLEGKTDDEIRHVIASLGVESRWWDMPAEIQRSPLKRVNLAFEAFYRRVKAKETPGYPRYRSWRRYDSLDLGRVKVTKNRVLIPKLGHVRFSLYRPLEGEIKSATIRHDATGKWWVAFSCDVGDAPAKDEPDSIAEERTVGIDLGITDLVTLSTGEPIPNPRFAKRAAEKLAQRQRDLARKRPKGARKGTKGPKTKNYERQRILVAKSHAHVANQRLDFGRKLTKNLFSRFDAVFYEDLNLVGLCRGDLSKSFADAAWGILIRCLVSKAEEAGKHTASVGARLTSQLCSGCGEIVRKERGERVHSCPHCGLTIGRDHNAALNVKGRGLDAFWSRPRSMLKEKPLDPLGI